MDYDIDFVDKKAPTSFGNLHYKYHNGEGKTLIFLHGLGATTMVWKKLVHFLPYGLNVYLVDLLGHGDSDAPQIDYSVGNQAKAINDFMKHELLDDVYMVGHSYGGWIAAYYATQYKLKGLVLEDAIGLKDAFDQIIAMKRVDDFKNVFFKVAMEMNNNKDYVIKSILDEDFRQGELDSATLSKIKAPTLILWGRRDLVLSPDIGALMQKKISKSKLVYIEDAGHDPHYMHPEEVTKDIMDFISVY